MPSAMYSFIRAATVSGSPTSAVPAPPRTRPTPGPEVRADFELITLSAMQLRNALLADRIHARKDLLCVGDGLIADMADEVVGRAPGRGIGLAHDDVQPDAEAETPPLFLSKRGDAANFLGHFAPAARPRSGICRPSRPRPRSRRRMIRRNRAAIRALHRGYCRRRPRLGLPR